MPTHGPCHSPCAWPGYALGGLRPAWLRRALLASLLATSLAVASYSVYGTALGGTARVPYSAASPRRITVTHLIDTGSWQPKVCHGRAGNTEYRLELGADSWSLQLDTRGVSIVGIWQFTGALWARNLSAHVSVPAPGASISGTAYGNQLPRAVLLPVA